MWNLIRLLIFVLCCNATIDAVHAQTSKRVALVIGNAAYQNVGRLNNTVNDATDIATSLNRLGFDVTRAIDFSGSDLRKALTAFGRAASGSDMAVVFYSGHGMEVSGENWLIPIDANLEREADISNEAISLKAVTQQIMDARQLGLIILDACRNNPFDARMQRNRTQRTVSRGLARVEPTGNILVAYAAKDGTTASDGTGRNSPFTTALLQNLEMPGLEVTFMFRNVRDDVLEATNQEQQPFTYGSLSRAAIYFKPIGNQSTPQPRPTVPKAPPVVVPPAIPQLPAVSFWEHNNSGMSIMTQGDRIQIFYERPRPGMIEEGVRKGTLLFDGQRSGNRLSGTAYVFDRNCRPIPYQDEGEVFIGQRQIQLNGLRVPTQLSSNCRAVGFRSDPSLFVRSD